VLVRDYYSGLQVPRAATEARPGGTGHHPGRLSSADHWKAGLRPHPGAAADRPAPGPGL